jgi:hypothetical protein
MNNGQYGFPKNRTKIPAGINSITNNVDNNLVTATGGDTLNGENGLTFNNGTLNIVGQLTQGKDCVASAKRAHAEGRGTQALGGSSHAEGEETKAIGVGSHAEGYQTQAGSDQGYLATIVDGKLKLNADYGDVTSEYNPGDIILLDDFAFENNYFTQIFTVINAQLDGTNTIITTNEPLDTEGSVVIGNITYGVQNWAGGKSIGGHYSHAEGGSFYAIGAGSHAEGSGTEAYGRVSHVEGEETKALGEYSHAEGYQTQAIGSGSHAEGDSTEAYGRGSHAEGGATQAFGNFSHAEGLNTVASGSYSHAEGWANIALGEYSHAEGRATQAIGISSHAEGDATQATGHYSHAEGTNTYAIGNFSHAEGQSTQASGSYSHAEGQLTIASGSYSHAEGYDTHAIGNFSHAEGGNAQAIGIGSHAEGLNTVALGSYQHVQGQFNLSSSIQSAFIVGNGTSLFSRSNLIFAAGSTVQITGSLDVSGSITINSGSITMPNRPGVRVVGSGGSKTAVTTLSGSYTVVDWQQSNAWDNSTGTFTAPIAGLYQINLVVRTASNSLGTISQLIVYKNNTGGVTGTPQIMVEYGVNTTMNHTGGSTISKLEVGDTLKMVVAVGEISFDGNDNFSVAYIG